MCSTLCINSNANEARNTTVTSEKDSCVAAKTRGTKIQKTRMLMNLAYVLKSYDGIDSLDNEDDSDEIQEYTSSRNHRSEMVRIFFTGGETGQSSTLSESNRTNYGLFSSSMPRISSLLEIGRAHV